MEEITRNDFSFFQNEILKDIKELEKKVNEKLSTVSKNFENTALIIEQKYENANVRMEEILKKLEEEKIMEKINDRLDKFNSKIEETITVSNTKIASFQKDLSNACFKYDKIFLNNISSPGLIGDGCPYQTMRSFLEYVNSKIKELISSKEKSVLDFKKYEEWINKSLDKFKEEIIDNKNEIKQYLIKEIKQYDKRSIEKMNIVEDKLSFIRIENGRYNYNLNKKWEELNEKLQLFYTMNENLVNIYNNSRKEYIQIKTKFNDLSDYFKEMKYSNKITSTKALFDELSKKIKVKSEKHEKINSETSSKYNNILPSIDDIPSIKLNKKNNNNSVQNFNIEIKETHSKLLKKKTFQIDNFGTTLNLKQNFYKNNLKTYKSNLNIIYDNNNINKTNNVKNPFERKLTDNINFSRINIKSYYNNYINEKKNESPSLLLKKDKSIKENSFKNIDNIEEQNKENSSFNTISNNNETKEKEKDNLENKNNNKNTNNNNNNNNNNENDIIKDIEINSSISKNNITVIEPKITNIENNNNNNNSNLNKNNSNSNLNKNNSNKIIDDDDNNNINYSNIVTKINLDEELNKVNQKFDHIYDKINYKILEITQQINILINQINKIVFRKDENIKKIKEIDFFVERKNKNIFLNNSGICLPYSTNKSIEENYKTPNNNEKENSFNTFNIKNKNKNSRNIDKHKLIFNNMNINRTKLANSTSNSNSNSNSNNIINLIKEKNSNKNYYIRMIDPLSINKIESYLIKKFTD